MSTYEVFDLLYNKFRKKFEDKNCVITHKYMPRSKRIHIHLLRNEKKTLSFEVP